MSTPILIALGFILLIAGSRLSWVYAGAIGFIISTLLIPRIYPLESQWSLLLISIEIAVISGMITLYTKRLILAVASFVAGAYLGIGIPALFLPGFPPLSTPVLGVIGLACLLLTLLSPTPPAILLSALLGALIIIQKLNLATIDAAVLYLVLTIFGAVTQAIMLRYTEPRLEST
jgi:hypothetical protein